MTAVWTICGGFGSYTANSSNVWTLSGGAFRDAARKTLVVIIWVTVSFLMSATTLTSDPGHQHGSFLHTTAAHWTISQRGATWPWRWLWCCESPRRSEAVTDHYPLCSKILFLCHLDARFELGQAAAITLTCGEEWGESASSLDSKIIIFCLPGFKMYPVKSVCLTDI